MGEDIVVKYTTMALDFQTESENLLEEITSGFTQTLESSAQNYSTLQDGYLKGFTDIVNQAKKANEDMIVNINRNFGEIKANLNQLYKQLQVNTTTAFDQSISQFTKQSDDIVKKFQGLSDTDYKDVVKYLKDRFSKTMADFAKRYKETMDQLDTKFATLVHDLKLPDIQPPTIVHPSLTTPAEPRHSNTRKSEKK